MTDDNKRFGALSTIRTFNRKAVILAEGNVEKHVSYIISGAVAFITTKNGNEICTNFFLKGAFFSSYVSFLTQVPSEFQIVAIENTTIEQIDYDSLEQAYAYSSEHQKNGRKIAENLYIKSNQRILSLLTQSAEERYAEFIQHHAQVMQHIPLKYIATYLGVTPESLSRLRHKMAKV